MQMIILYGASGLIICLLVVMILTLRHRMYFILPIQAVLIIVNIILVLVCKYGNLWGS